MTPNSIPQEVLDQVERDRELIAAELPELEERHARMVEAKQENTIGGQIRRAIHSSGRLVREIADDAGISSEQLGGFLEGTGTLRSDVLERILQAVHAEVLVTPRRK